MVAPLVEYRPDHEYQGADQKKYGRALVYCRAADQHAGNR
jgi:hypothetical protein